MDINIVYNESAVDGLKNIPDNSVNCCVTSPPYYGLRDYGMDDQIGLEKTPEEFIKKLVDVFREVKRVLRDDGTLWVNIGDSYAGSGRGSSSNPNAEWKSKTKNTHTLKSHTNKPAGPADKIKSKDLFGIPWMLAFALRDDGWYLRQDIIWHKPNAMPQSATDRCANSHEYIFLLSKCNRYYFDNEAIKQPAKCKENRAGGCERNRTMGYDSKRNNNPEAYLIGGKKRSPKNLGGHMNRVNTSRVFTPKEMVNKRSVWSINIKPSRELHFAMFPDELIVDCIKAGSPEGGVVLDPFMGSGTTAVVSRKLNRNYIGCELNPDSIKIIDRRIYNELGMFN